MPDDKDKQGFSWDDEDKKQPAAGATATGTFEWGPEEKKSFEEVKAEAAARVAKPLQTEVEHIGKGYIPPEQERENQRKYAWYGPIVSLAQKHGFGASNVLSNVGTGLKEVGGTIVGAAKDISSDRPLFFGDESGPRESTFHKYVIAPSERENEKAQRAGSGVESVGHSIAAGLPVIGPAFANLAEQAGTGDVGGATGRGAGQALGAKLISKAGSTVPEVNVNPLEVGRGVGEALRTRSLEPIGKGVQVKAPPALEEIKEAGQKAADVAGNPYTLGLSGEKMLKQGVGPRARATGWDKAVDTAKDDIKRYHTESPIKTPQDFVEALPEIKEKVWSEEVQPALDRQAGRPVDMRPAAEAVRKQVSPEMREFDEGNAAELDKLADKLEKARDVESANRLLTYANGKLESYFSKYPTARHSNLLNNPETAGWEAARSATREQLMQTLEDAGESNIRSARERYGALKEIQKEVERRPNVADRRKPMSLPRIMALFSALPTAGVGLALGEIAHQMGEPAYLINEGLNRLPEPGPRAALPNPPAFERPQPVAGPSPTQRAIEPNGPRPLSTVGRVGGSTTEALAPIEMRGGFAKTAPKGFEPVLKDTGWQYGGKNSMGLHEFKDPKSNISITVKEADLTPEKVRERIAAKLKEFGR